MTTIVVMFLAVTVQAARILWTTVDHSAEVLQGGTTTPVTSFANAQGHQVNAVRFEAGSKGYEYTLMIVDSYQGEVFEYDTMELNLGEWWSGMYISTSLGDDPGTDLPVRVWLGYVDWQSYDDSYDESDPLTWDIPFEKLAFAESSVGSLMDRGYTYPTFDLNPPGTDWRPMLYEAIPEPAVTFLALLGALLLWFSSRRRK